MMKKTLLQVKGLTIGYKGKTYILIDNEDKEQELYKRNFGAENIIVFNKEEAIKRYNGMSNFYKKNVILWARNEAQRIAREKGLRYILELDDDYTSFQWRYENEKGEKISLKPSKKHKKSTKNICKMKICVL